MTKISQAPGKSHVYSAPDLESGRVSESASLAHESERLLSMGDPPREMQSIKPALKIDVPASKDMGNIFMVPLPVPQWLIVPGGHMAGNDIAGFSYTDEPGATPEPPSEFAKTRARVPMFFTFELEHPAQVDANNYTAAPVPTMFKYESHYPGHRPHVPHKGSGGKLDCAPNVIGRAGVVMLLGGAASLVVGGLWQAGVLDGGDDTGQSVALLGGGGVSMGVGLHCVYHFYKHRRAQQTTATALAGTTRPTDA
ncbi:MAG: hypothetical protein K0Q43_598 [Ramlibacter sp.]|nr:hypothetical protein [Ramlibacter sp.]